MERDSLLAHGAAFSLNDRLMKCSDYSEGYVCRKCGSIISCYLNTEIQKNELEVTDGTSPYNVNKAVFCRSCNDYDCKKISLPYVLRYMTNELSAMNIKMNFTLDTELVQKTVKKI